MQKNKDVFSEFCEYDEPVGGPQGRERRSPVYVQLWEWNYDDIAKDAETCGECEFGCLTSQRQQRGMLRLGLNPDSVSTAMLSEIPEAPACDCPQRIVADGRTEYAVPVDGVCSWCTWR